MLSREVCACCLTFSLVMGDIDGLALLAITTCHKQLREKRLKPCVLLNPAMDEGDDITRTKGIIFILI